MGNPAGGLYRQEVTIDSGDTASEAFEFQASSRFGIIFPAAMTGATYTFQASDREEGTYVALEDDAGNAIGGTITASTAVGVSGTDLECLTAFRWLKIVSASAEGADRVLIVVGKSGD